MSASVNNHPRTDRQAARQKERQAGTSIDSLRHACRQADRDRQTGCQRQTDRQTDKYIWADTERKTGKLADIQIRHRQIGWQADRQIDIHRHASRQADGGKQTGRLTDKQIRQAGIE